MRAFEIHIDFIFLSSLILISYSLLMDGGCPKFWYRLSDHCYYRNGNHLVTRDENKANCESMNANLVSVHNREEDAFLKNLTQNGRFWLGGERVERGKGLFRWSDNSSFDFNIWGPTEPSELNAEESKCMYMYNEMWYTSMCSHQFGQLCKMPVLDRISRIEANLKHVEDMMSALIKVSKDVDDIKKYVEQLRIRDHAMLDLIKHALHRNHTH